MKTERSQSVGTDGSRSVETGRSTLYNMAQGITCACAFLVYHVFISCRHFRYLVYIISVCVCLIIEFLTARRSVSDTRGAS